MEATAARGARNPVGRAFRILVWMAPRDDGPWGVREIAKGVGMSPSTVHRLLGMLEEEGLVRQDDPGGGYAVGTERPGGVFEHAFESSRSHRQGPSSVPALWTSDQRQTVPSAGSVPSTR